MLAAGLPQLHPSMLPLDPNSPFKHVFNPALLSYRYPFGMTQPLKTFSSQASISPLSGGGGATQVTPTPQAAPGGVVYPLTPSPNLAAFHSAAAVGEGGSTTISPAPGGNATTQPMLQVQGIPSQQPHSFSGLITTPIHVSAGKDDRPEDKVQALSWMQNPAAAVMGSGLNVMPYLMGQNQLGIGAAAAAAAAAGGIGIAGSQQAAAMSMLNSNLPMGSGGGGGGGGGGDGGSVPKVGTPKDNTFAASRGKTHTQRRGSLVDIPSQSVFHRSGEASPSPLGVTSNTKMSPFSLVPDANKWKALSEQGSSPILMPAYGMNQNPPTSSPYSTTAMPGHVMPVGFPPMVGSGAPTSHLPKNRGSEGVGHSASPRMVHDKMKLRIHQVRNDDFKMQVKPDRRRKKWRGKDKDILLSSRAELAESAVRRMGMLATEPLPLPKDVPPIPALPISLGVEPGFIKQQQGVAVAEKQGDPKNIPASGSDGNYALNILADMSSIQSKETQSQNEGKPITTSLVIPPAIAGDAASTTVQPYLRSPVSLAARSLLMLGEDMNMQENSHLEEGEGERGEDKAAKPPDSVTTQVENTAATSLLQLSGAVLPGRTAHHHDDPVGEDQETGNPSRTTRLASFSAAEAMIMMGTGKEEGEEPSPEGQRYTELPPQGGGVGAEGVATALREGNDDAKTPMKLNKRRKPQNLSMNSEDTDSEATLTPESPNVGGRGYGRLPPFVSSSDERESAGRAVDGVRGTTPPGRERRGESVRESTSSSHVEHTGPVRDPIAINLFARELPLYAHQSTVEDKPMEFQSRDPSVQEDKKNYITEHAPAVGQSDNAISPLDATENLTAFTHLAKRDDKDSTQPLHDSSSSPALIDVEYSSVSPPPAQLEERRALHDNFPATLNHHMTNSDTPPADRPKFISTFGPAANKEVQSVLPLDGEDRGTKVGAKVSPGHTPGELEVADMKSGDVVDTVSGFAASSGHDLQHEDEEMVTSGGEESPNVNSSLSSDVNISLGSDVNSSLSSDVNINLGSNVNSGLGSDVNISLGSNVNSGLSANVNSSLGSDVNINLGSDVNISLGSDVNSGLSANVNSSLSWSSSTEKLVAEGDSCQQVDEDVNEVGVDMTEESTDTRPNEVEVKHRETEVRLSETPTEIRQSAQAEVKDNDAGSEAGVRDNEAGVRDTSETGVGDTSETGVGDTSETGVGDNEAEVKDGEEAPTEMQTTVVLSSSEGSNVPTSIREGSPRKVKVSKKRIEASLSEKVRLSPHGKTRVIKIKRAKSPKTSRSLPPNQPADDSSQKALLPSWAAFADAAMESGSEKTGADNEGGVAKITQAATEEIDRLHSDDTEVGPGSQEASRDLPPAQSPAEQAPKVSSPRSSDATAPTDSPVAPQNALKLNRTGGSHRQHTHKQHATAGKLGRESKTEDQLFGKRTASKPQKESKTRDLFEMDLPKRDVSDSRDAENLKPAKLSKPSPHAHLAYDGLAKVSVKGGKHSPAGPGPRHHHHHHHHSGSDGDMDALSSELHSTHRTRDIIRVLHDHEPKPRSSHPSSAQDHQAPPANPAHSPFGLINREREFSPLSDDNGSKMNSPRGYASAKDVRSSKFVVEEEEWKARAHRRHQTDRLDDTSLPSPSSSLGSSSSKKHHHRHHDALTPVGVVSNDTHNKREHRSDKSSSRGPSPERKRHHHHHHRRRRHHHSHDGRHSGGTTPQLFPTIIAPSLGGRGIAGGGGGGGDDSGHGHSYESISDDDVMFDMSPPPPPPQGKEGEELTHRSLLHEDEDIPPAARPTQLLHRKRKRANSDGSVESSGTGGGGGDILSGATEALVHSLGRHSSGGAGKHKKMKRSKEHKERWKEHSSKHKHARKQH